MRWPLTWSTDGGDAPVAGSHVAEQLPRLVAEDVGQDVAAGQRVDERVVGQLVGGRLGRVEVDLLGGVGDGHEGVEAQRRATDRQVDPLAAVAVQVAVAVPQRPPARSPTRAAGRSPGPPRTAGPGRLPASRSPRRTRTRSPPGPLGVAASSPHIVPHLRFWRVSKSSRNIRRVGTGSWTGSSPAIAATRYDEMVDADGAPARAHEVAVRGAGAAVHRRSRRARRGPGPQLPAAGDHVLLVRRGVGLPARPGAAADRRGRVGAHRGRRRAAGARPRGVPRPTSTATARCSATAWSRTRSIFTSSNFCRAAAGIRPASGVRIHLAGIDLVRGADGRHAGARGQPAGAVGHLLRGREPGGA